jgi:hypothetical protein
MRRGFYCLMMLVLVLRGLTGTAMAAGMVPASKPCAALAVLDTAHGTGPVDHGAGHGHAPLPLDEGAPHAAAHALGHGGPAAEAPCHGADHGGCAHAAPEITASGQAQGDGTCCACDICHSAMLALPIVLADVPARIGASLPDASARFHSAPATLAFEPPIG